jgi:hypothetical protein
LKTSDRSNQLPTIKKIVEGNRELRQQQRQLSKEKSQEFKNKLERIVANLYKQ